jgi:hypothetical protein
LKNRIVKLKAIKATIILSINRYLIFIRVFLCKYQYINVLIMKEISNNMKHIRENINIAG